MRAWIVAVAVMGCRSASMRGDARIDDGVAPLPSIAPVVEEDTPERHVLRLACPETDCATRVSPAGSDVEGRSLWVVTVITSVDSGEDPMETREHWAVGVRDQRVTMATPIGREWIVSSTPIAHTLEVANNQLVTSIKHWPTSTWQSYPSRTFQLSPALLTSFSASPRHNSDSDTADDVVFGTVELDLKTGAGSSQFMCGRRRGQYLPIPSAPAAKGFDAAKGLGHCGVQVDGSKDHGFMAAGVAHRQSGWFRVSMLDKLYVEVHDDHWTSGDAIEIRTQRPVGFFGCSAELVPTQVFVIDGEGTVKGPPGDGDLEVSIVARDTETRTFAITRKEWKGGLTVVQRDDDGSGTPRVIATSPIATSIELGDVAPIADVACDATVEGAAFVPHLP